MNTSSQYAGLFGQIATSGVVKNFYITDSLFKSTSSDLGSVAGVAYGTVDTVYSNASVIAGGYRTGGIVGHVPWHNTTAYIKNCWFDGDMELVGSASQAGGILGYVANEWTAGVSITNCLYTGSIDFAATSANWGLRIGGIVGGARDYYTPTITIENCLSAGKITQSSGSTATPAVSAVYGGFDELRATTLNLTNVYGTNECFAVARIYHQYINPERDVPEEAVKVHGLTYDFLKNYPKLSEIAQDFIDFVGDDAILVAHNASFDINFINYEFKHKGFKTYSWDKVIDTLEIARSKFPGSRNNLDALCHRFNIDNSSRTKHGALLDAELLAEVYLELLGGAEPSMELSSNIQKKVEKEDIKIERNY